MQNPLSRMSRPAKVTQDLKVRLLLLLVFAGSVALAWWSINRLPVWEARIRAAEGRIGEVERDIMDLERRWNEKEAAQISDKLKESQEQLLGGRDEVAQWQTSLQRSAKQFTLAVNAGVTRTQDCPLPGKRFSIYSETLDVGAISPGTRTNSPY